MCYLCFAQILLQQAAYSAYGGYGSSYTNPQLPATTTQTTAYAAYPPTYSAQVVIIVTFNCSFLNFVIK